MIMHQKCHIPPRILLLQDHYQAAKKTETHPDEGTWPAYPSGKSWDEARRFQGDGNNLKPWSVQGWLRVFFCDSLVLIGGKWPVKFISSLKFMPQDVLKQ